jgi:hypothetical protein
LLAHELYHIDQLEALDEDKRPDLLLVYIKSMLKHFAAGEGWEPFKLMEAMANEFAAENVDGGCPKL